MNRIALVALMIPMTLSAAAPATAAVKVVTTLPSYAAIAREIGGDRVDVHSISRPDEDSHFVKPKPSLALMLKNADLFITTGLDLELWGPTLVDKSGNRRIRDGEPGFLSVSHGVPMLDVPASTSRSGGDIHIYGNPHIHTSPINAKIIARNIAEALERVDASGAPSYRESLAAFRQGIDEALYGKELVEILGSDALDALARKGELIPFLEQNELDGRPLLDRLGGWLAQALPFRGERIIAYHMNWIYFTSLFGLEVEEFVEVKPGIPPSARHVHELVKKIESEGIDVLLSATYFDASKPKLIADRTGCTVVRVRLEPGEGQSYFDLLDVWIDSLTDAFRKQD